jgi:hypothetical protein
VRSSQVEDRYIDTVDGALARAGFAARIRQTAKTTTVAVKSAARSANGALHRREELEGPADRTSPPRDWPPSDARSLILELCGDAPLVEVVTIRQLRRKRILERPDGAVEVSLDEVDAVTRSRVVGRFVELEVELVRGEEAGLEAVGAILATDKGLAPADASKLESALQAIAATEPRRTKKGGRVLPPIDVDDQEARDQFDDGLDVGRIVAAALGEATRASKEGRAEAANGGPAASNGEGAAAPNGEGAAAPVATPEPARPTATKPVRPKPPVDEAEPTPEADHREDAGRPRRRPSRRGRSQGPPLPPRPDDREGGRDAGRRGTRRTSTRCASRPVASGRRGGSSARPSAAAGTRAHRKRLREVAARLGAVRDLDVLIEAADQYRPISPSPSSAPSSPCSPAGGRTVTTPGCSSCASSTRTATAAGWTTTRSSSGTRASAPGRSPRPEPHRVRDTAASRIQAAYEQVRAYEPVLRWADVDTLHELRIAGQVAALLAGVRARSARPGLGRADRPGQRAQDHLGCCTTRTSRHPPAIPP